MIKPESNFAFEHYTATGKRPQSEFLRFHVSDNFKQELAALENSTHSEIHISGLKQNSLEYFVLNYAQRFSIINFACCRLVQDFSCLETLAALEYLMIELNIRATKLWNMKKNLVLWGIYLWDTKKITNLSDLAIAPNLKELAIKESVNSALAPNNWRLASLAPLTEAPSLERLYLAVSKVEDESIAPLLKMSGLKRLQIITDLFTLEDFALLNAKLTDTIITPNKPFYIYPDDDYALVVGQGRQIKSNSPKLAELQERWDKVITQNQNEAGI